MSKPERRTRAHGWPAPFKPAPAWRAPLERYIGASAMRGPFPWSRVMFALGELALVGLGVALLSGLRVIGRVYGGFVTSNSVVGSDRTTLAILAVGGFVGLPLLGLIGLAIGRRRFVPFLERWADRLSPLALLFAVPALLQHNAWTYRPLPYLVLLSCVVLLGQPLLMRSFATFGPRHRAPNVLARAVPWRRWLPVVCVVLGASGFFAWGAFYTIQCHHKLRTASFDLGIYDNLMFNALKGYPFRSPVLFGPSGGNYLAGHAEFAMLFFLPVYALLPRAETLLALQAFLVGFAALPLYFFAKTQIPRWAAASLAVAYLFFAPLHGPLFYDFHWIMVAPFFHFLLFFAIATRRRRWLAVFLGMLLLIREDMGVGTAVLGVFLVLFSEQAITGLTILVVSAAWFGLDKFVIMPWAGTWWFAELYRGLMAPGENGYASVINTLLINPIYVLQSVLTEAKLTYFAHLFAPLAWLPARRLALLLLASPGIFFTILTTNSPPMVSIAFQYSAHWVAYLFGATVLALRFLGEGRDGALRQRAALVMIVFGIVAHSYVFGGILQRGHFIGGFQYVDFNLTPQDKRNYADLRAVIAQIPKDASVAASDTEVAHVSARELVYALREVAADADYLLLNKNSMAIGNTLNTTAMSFTRNDYGLVDHIGPFYLFKRGVQSDKTLIARKELGVAPK